MSSETRSPADAAFERRLLESAREDAEPGDVEGAWARLAGGLGALLPAPGGAPGGLRLHAAAAGAGTATAVKWLLVGALAGSGVTGALLMGHRPSPTSRAAPEQSAQPTAPAGQGARPAEPVNAVGPASSTVERAAPAEAPRAAKHRLALGGAPARREQAPSTLAAQVSRIDTARVAIASGDYDEAMRLIARYHDDFPEGALAPDADVVGLEAAAAKHDSAEVARRAQSFLARYPNDPHTARVEWLSHHPHPADR
jgi:hypothetical protein